MLFIFWTPIYSQRTDSSSVVGLTTVEEFPKFNNGDITRFALWIFSNLHYPEKAIKESISGIVIIRFLIDSLGFLNKPAVLKGKYPDLNEEVLRVVESSPRWIPGRNFDKSTDVYLNVAIEFSLDDKNFENKIKKLSRLDKRMNK